MAIVVGTNYEALRGHRTLERVAENQTVAMKRLSSGLKINSARDDAAGLQISNRLGVQTRGMDSAIRNANDGLSILQTAEGAMAEYAENLVEMRDLTLRYANGSLNSDDRESTRQEYTALKDELYRISETTSFGGQRLLNGIDSHKMFQVGPESGDTISIHLPHLGEAKQEDTTKERRHVRFSEYKKDWISKSGDVINVQRVDSKESPHQTVEVLKIAIKPGSSMIDVAEQLNDELGGDAYFSTEDYETSDGLSSQRIVYYSGHEDEYVAIRHYHEFYPHNQHNPFGSEKDRYHSAWGDISNETTLRVIPSLEDPKLVNSVLEDLDSLIASVDSERAKIGAVQNRLSHAIANLSQSSENVAASTSRIRDTDFAKETSAFTKQKILKDTNTAMLVQANASTGNAIGLLGVA